MNKRHDMLPPSWWSDTGAGAGPAIHTRIVRTSTPTPPGGVQRISIVCDSPMPLPLVTELDANTGWAEFQKAVRRQDNKR